MASLSDHARNKISSRWSKLRYELRKNRLNKFYSKWIEKFHTGNGILLDIGCGDGSFMNYMKLLGWDLFATEINEGIIRNLSEDLKSRIVLVSGALDEANFRDDSFDVVALWNVFEHVADINNLLDTIKKILKKKGLLVLQVPNIESLEARVFRMNWAHLDLSRHVHHFSPRTLCSALTKKDFKINAITHFSPIDKSYRGSFENLVKSKLRLRAVQYFFHNIFYKALLDILFIPLNIIGSIFKKGTFITIACINEK